MRFKFPSWFFEPVIFEGKTYELLYELGHVKKRISHQGFEISDTRPFLWGKLPKEALGKTITVREKPYVIESVESTGEDYFVYYLGKTRNAHKI